MMEKHMSGKRNDVFFMEMALEQSRKAAMKGEVPVGAVLVLDDEIVSRDHNRSVSGNDATAHAEILVIRDACRKMKNYRLPGSAIYVTLEPCAMCLGAVIQARIGGLVFGARDPKSGACVSIIRFPWEKVNHRLDVREGVLAEACARILKEFFKNRRR